MDPAIAISRISDCLGIDPDDLTIEIRNGGRTTVVAYAANERIIIAMLQGFEELRPYVEGLTTPRTRLSNVVSANVKTP